MDVTDEEFADFTLDEDPELLAWYIENFPDDIDEILSNRFVMGWITGVYPGGGLWEDILSVGPNGEKAWADQYAVFYRKGTYHFKDNAWGNEPCDWVYDIPQGFSCVVGAKPNECSGQFDRYVPVDCNEIVLKVARKVFDCNGDPDCFEGVNWG